MEKSVGSVDIEELRRAREELNRERGIENDPNMYKSYNPNRKEEDSSANSASDDEIESEEAVSAQEDDSMDDDVDKLIASVEKSFEYDEDEEDLEEDDTIAQESDAFVDPIPEPAREKSAEELDRYDAFAAFEINDGKISQSEEKVAEETTNVHKNENETEESDAELDGYENESAEELSEGSSEPYYIKEYDEDAESGSEEYDSKESVDYEEGYDERLYENSDTYTEDVGNEDEYLSQQETEEVVGEIEGLYEDNLEEIQRPKKNYPELPEYSFVDVIALDEFKDSHKLSFLLGRDEEGVNVYGNLRDFYNMVIFGKESTAATNVVHSALLSLILKNTVDEINFVICDSKNDSKFEAYNASSYMYFNRIAKTNKEILDTLIEVGKELEERYKMLASVGVKSIEQYNVIAKNDNLKPLPYLVTVFNNYSKAVQLTESDKINACLYQILKLGRIVGLYLIIVANGPIRSDEVNYNLPTRIAFKTEEEIDSITTLGVSGAESLKVDDEFLYSTIDSEDTEHIKAPMLTQVEIELLVQNIEE